MENKFLWIVVVLFSSNVFSANLSAMPTNMYAKFGLNNYFSRSNTLEVSRVNAIPGTISPSYRLDSFNDSSVNYNIALGYTILFNNKWKLSPELSLLRLDTFRKSFNYFSTYILDGFPNSYTATLDGYIATAGLMIEYQTTPTWSFYVEPGLGVGTIYTSNTLTYQTQLDSTPFYGRSSDHQNKIIPKLAIGMNYYFSTKNYISFSLDYTYIGSVKAGTFSKDYNLYSHSDFSFKNVYLLGPSIQFVYYL